MKSTLFSPEITSAERAQKNSILLTRHYPDLSSAFDWLEQVALAARPIRSATRRVISVEFLGSFLRRHFAGKLVVTSQNVGCFLRLEVYFYSRHLMEPTRIVSGSFEAQSGFYSSVRNSGSHFH